jgi:sugar lactone lactonase YvrE
MAIGLGGSDTFRKGFGDGGQLLGTLVNGKIGNPGVSLFADVVANEVANNPEPEDIDSDPVGLVRQGSSFVVADAGGNDVLKVSHKGDFSTVAVLPFLTAVAPPFTGAKVDPVPTEVVIGPDRAYYVSELTGFPFEKGAANIYRIVPGHQPTVYASGLTNVTDLEFARNGDLYAVQISTNGLLTGPVGSLVKVNPHSSTHQVVADGLNAPYGVALDRHSAYVSTCATCTGGGTVIKIPLGRDTGYRNSLTDDEEG